MFSVAFGLLATEVEHLRIYELRVDKKQRHDHDGIRYGAWLVKKKKMMNSPKTMQKVFTSNILTD